jgi:multimeric flavodoxin WrbA
MADDGPGTSGSPVGAKRVLAVIGSPHRGATVRAVERIEARLRVAGDIEVEYLYLRDTGLEPCRGCFCCIAEGEVFCPVHDGRDEVLARLDACDGAIFASPNYVQNVSGLYKTFVDRFAWICHRPRFYAKPALAVATSAGPFGLKETLAAIQTGPAAWGFVFVDEVGIAMHPRLGAGAESTEMAASALDRAAERLAAALHTRCPVPARALAGPPLPVHARADARTARGLPGRYGLLPPPRRPRLLRPGPPLAARSHRRCIRRSRRPPPCPARVRVEVLMAAREQRHRCIGEAGTRRAVSGIH